MGGRCTEQALDTYSMDTDQGLERARDLALQKIGRNLVNLQKLEGMLKHLLATVHLEGYSSEIADKARRRQERASKMTMGQLIQELKSSLFDDQSSAQGRLELTSEVWISTKFTIEGGSEAASQWESELSAIRTARNELVHHMLTTFNPNSLEDCRTLASALDAQRERLIPIYEHVQSLIVARDEALAELAKKF